MNRLTVLFDDDRGRFGPLTDLRAVFELRSGVFTLRERLEAMTGAPVAGWVPERLAALERERGAIIINDLPEAEAELVLAVNGRLLLPVVALELDREEAIVEAESGAVIAALLPRSTALGLLHEGHLEEWVPRRTAPRGTLVERPWHLLDVLREQLAFDATIATPLAPAEPPAWAHVVGSRALVLDATAEIAPGVVLDVSGGPIVGGAGSTIRPHAVVVGPCAIGPGTIVAEHALVKAATAIGPACRVAGEVGGTIMQGFANKSHDGHLGDALVGEWVNLGAGTTNSNLLNTYGEVTVRLEPDGPRERSGRTFFGSVIGDHVRTAIGTRLMTGTVLGTAAMIATTAPPPTTVERFAWLTDDGARRYRPEKFVESMRLVMKRRNREPGAAYLARIEALAAALPPMRG